MVVTSWGTLGAYTLMENTEVQNIGAAFTKALTVIDGEARIKDTDLATILGYARPADFRRTVTKHRIELEALGVLRQVDVEVITSHGARHSVQAFMLNETQMMHLATRARTPAGKALGVWSTLALQAFKKAVEEGRIQVDEQTKGELQSAMSEARKVYLEDAEKCGGVRRSENDACFGKATRRLLRR